MPWLDAKEAERYRTVLFNEIYKTEVNPERRGIPSSGAACDYVLIAADTITAAIQAHKAQPTSKIVLLNFASFRYPGGGFMSNAIAQEECLCYCTTLYPALEAHHEDWYTPHATRIRNGMYENQSLLSHDVQVLASAPGVLLPQEQRFCVDVLTCAAPNWTAALKYNTLPMETLEATTRDRIDYVMQILSAGEYDEVILGAYGCGVFKNDPKLVAAAFREAMTKYAFSHVTFAIPDENSRNYKTFQRVLNNASK